MAQCLVIDDSDVIRLIMRKILESLDHTVIEATSADDSLKIMQDGKADVIFLDWDLPSLAALDFLKGVSELSFSRAPKIILCTAENDPQQLALAKAAGAEFHLLKPFDLGSVRDALGQAGFEAAISDEKAAS